jgi:hypothetical protein
MLALQSSSDTCNFLATTVLLVRLWFVRTRSVTRAACWDGGIRRLLPEMSYTATGFSNPVRVIFEAILKPALAEDRRATVAAHLREAIRRTRDEEHVVDRLVLKRLTKRTRAVAAQLARIHHGQLTLYVVYGLPALLTGFIIVALLRISSP